VTKTHTIAVAVASIQHFTVKCCVLPRNRVSMGNFSEATGHLSSEVGYMNDPAENELETVSNRNF